MSKLRILGSRKKGEKVRAKSMKWENRKIGNKVSETKSWFFGKIDKIIDL